MPWIKIKYPDAMKKLPRSERKEIIKKAKALLKENKKQIEELFLNIAIEHIKDMKAKAVNKKKGVAKKKIKVTAKKKIKSSLKRKPANVAEKKIKGSAKQKAKIVIRTKTKKPVTEITSPETITHTEDAHSVLGQVGMHPVTTLEAHQIENGLHHREEVSFHQENQKVKAAMASRKNSKRTYRMTGQR